MGHKIRGRGTVKQLKEIYYCLKKRYLVRVFKKNCREGWGSTEEFGIDSWEILWVKGSVRERKWHFNKGFSKLHISLLMFYKQLNNSNYFEVHLVYGLFLILKCHSQTRIYVSCVQVSYLQIKI